MKKRTKKAPYLRIAGEKINIGETYYTVDYNNGDFQTHIASTQNNTISNCYFTDINTALAYSEIVRAVAGLIKIKTKIESSYRQEGQKIK